VVLYSGQYWKEFCFTSLPPPPGVFHLCFGSYTYTTGAKYVGIFKDDEAWKGVEYDKGGKERFIYRIGIRLPKLW